MSREEQTKMSGMLRRQRYNYLYAVLFRYWAVGAICFMIVFGTSLGATPEGSWDLIVVLTIIIGVANLLLIDYVCEEYFMQLRRERKERKWYYFRYLRSIAFTAVVMSLVVATYYLINTYWRLLAVEPYLFSLFYLVFYYLALGARFWVLKLWTRKEQRRKNEKATVN